MAKQEKTRDYGQKIASRAEDFAAWYNDVVLAAQLADYSPVRGAMVIRPYGFALWEHMQRFLDTRFKATGVENAYFPLLIPESLLAKEADHVEGFVPEVAWVTHGGTEKLEERLAVRPTSEAIMMQMYSQWVQSWRDLPMVLNQWNSVVRWELRTRLFLRTSEFLWQEGHTVHANAEEATARTLQMLDVYRAFIEEELAIPVIVGRKTPSERFPGAAETYTAEALMGDGRALQSATSHDFSDHFTRAFEIDFLDRDGGRSYAYSTSWGLSTRTIGGIIMVHGDEKGLILPPKVAPVQVIIVPIWRKDEEQETVRAYVDRVQAALGSGVRVRADWTEEKSPGWKFNEWELRGAPLRIEAGPRDAASESVVLVRRDTREKQPVALADLSGRVDALLAEVQQALYDRALADQREHTFEATDVEQMLAILDDRRGFILAGWCGSAACEATVKERTRATIRVIPFDSAGRASCPVCGTPDTERVYYARAY
jgi:prolyl-tRNA synthetase